MSQSWLEEYNLLIFDRIDSTNSEAMRLVNANVRGDFVIIAREQTAGRGQKGRAWTSVVGNLYATILLESEIGLNRLSELSFLTGVVLHKTIKRYINKPDIDIKLKWPNDVLVSGKKIAGILLESKRHNNKNYLIIGIGVNTHFFPEIENLAATSLLNEGIIIKNPDDFLSDFMVKFQSYYKKWKIGQTFDIIREEWLKNAYGFGENINLYDGRQNITGMFVGIDSFGGICIKLADSRVVSFAYGDVKFLG